jgi:hypothetical protein
VPCQVLVVGGVGSRAAVEDADEPVCEGAQSLVVGGSAGALPVVEGACAWGVVQRGEPLQQQCVAEAAVAGEPGQDNPFGAGGFGDRRHTGVVLPRFGVDVAAWVVAELGKHPGTEDDTEARLAAVDLNVWVLTKTEVSDLLCKQWLPI